jgi:Family of unknown function (DUF6519)
MHGDFSRDSYRRDNNFTRVLLQQGRLLVDADWNEQTAIVLNYLRSLAMDLIGWHGGPDVDTDSKKVPNGGAFAVKLDKDKKAVYNPGRYYIDGWLIQPKPLTAQVDSWNRPDTLNDDTTDKSATNLLVYLDVWQRFLPGFVDPYDLRDPALLGLDTSGRAQLQYVVKAVKTKSDEKSDELKDRSFGSLNYPVTSAGGATSQTPIDLRYSETPGVLPSLTAWTKRDAKGQVPDECADDAGSGFTGLENQLYRVEIHRAGDFWDGTDGNSQSAFTLKWSRDNGSVVYSAELGQGSALLKSKWRDDTKAIELGDWIELIKEPADTGSLVQVKDVRDDGGQVTFTFDPPKDSTLELGDEVLLRRWDHRTRKDFPLSQGGILVAKDKSGDISVELPLEDNILVQLSLVTAAKFYAGDYWMIPARAATNDILWPRNPEDPTKPGPVPARYTAHYYAPLALIKSSATEIIDLRRKITQAAVVAT